MFLRIENIENKLLCGHKAEMSLVENKTFELWSGFMPMRNRVKYKKNDLFFSVQVYENLDYFRQFNPSNSFTKWAAVEVSEKGIQDDDFNYLDLESGLYAVFLHKGLPSDFPKTASYIYSNWVPKSEYELDHRPHFEVLDERYKRDDPSSEEEVWIPIKKGV